MIEKPSERSADLSSQEKRALLAELLRRKAAEADSVYPLSRERSRRSGFLPERAGKRRLQHGVQRAHPVPGERPGLSARAPGAD